MQQKSWLKQERKLCRLQFAEKRVYTNKKWRRVIFIDEKRFNLSGPDGLHYYYRGITEGATTSESSTYGRRRYNDGGGIGKLEIKFITGKLNSNKLIVYNKNNIETIDEQINTYATRIAENKYIFVTTWLYASWNE